MYQIGVGEEVPTEGNEVGVALLKFSFGGFGCEITAVDQGAFEFPADCIERCSRRLWVDTYMNIGNTDAV